MKRTQSAVKKLGITVAVCLSMLACNRGPRPIAKGEPAGHSVELTAADLEGQPWAAEYMKPWLGWHFKGISLLKQEGGEPESERRLQAIYCFHQALAAWPKKLPDTATDLAKTAYTAEPTDTLLQLGWLYLKMNEPSFALAYFKRAETYMPGNGIVTKGIADAEAMMSPKVSN